MKEDDKVTIESLLRSKLTLLFEEMNERNGDLFDENTDIIEMLMCRDTKGYKELTEYQSELKQALLIRVSKVEKDSAKCTNPIARKRFEDKKKYEYEWKYRKDYLFKIIDIFMERNILESEQLLLGIIEQVKT